MIGRVIGTYKIVQKLGEGGMGAVYKGVDTMLDREVAIKALKPELASQTAIVERFRSEAVTLAKLNHPNIATLYSLFRQGDELYMVLEYVRGETLDAMLARRGSLPTDEVIPVFCQILDGINHAHEYGIIHRDIKPANMILTESGILKVLDFGIARLLGTNRMTRAGNIIGTLEYMAPEQVKGLETDARSDTYALGMMLYEVLTGRTPFNTDNEFELMKLQTECLPPSPRLINPTIPESVEAAIMRAIQKDPNDRFQTAGDLREFLLDAGFAEYRSMRRITGPRQSIPATQSVPTISKPDATGPTAESEIVIKETRLGSTAAASLYAGQMKETRLGEGVAEFPMETDAEPQRETFFSRLTWVHYAGAGSVVLVVFISFLVLIPIVMFSGVFTQTKAVDNKPANVNSVNTNTRETKISTPDPVKETVKAPVANPTPEPVSREPVGITPIDKPTLEPVEEPKAVERTKTSPPAKKAAPPVKRTPEKRPAGSKRDVQCALTGDC